MSQWTIRPAGTDDTDTLVRLGQAMAEHARLNNSLSADGLRAALFGPLPKAHALLAVDLAEGSGRAVGFALWNYNFDLLSGRPGIYLTDIYLIDSYRGRGVAFGFFKSLARLARDEGCAQLQWSALVRHGQAMSLYQSLGAIPVAAWTSQKLTGEALLALAA